MMNESTQFDNRHLGQTQKVSSTAPSFTLPAGPQGWRIKKETKKK
jgi:hypothetical protein